METMQQKYKKMIKKYVKLKIEIIYGFSRIRNHNIMIHSTEL